MPTVRKRWQINKTLKKLEKLCTASNKAFLCISSRIVTFFLIEQSYVAKTSCKMSAKHLRFSWWHINYPCGQNNKIFCFHRVGVNIFSVLAARRITNPSNAEDESRTEEWDSGYLCPSTHFLACLVTMLRGGVTGRLPLGFFFSAGFKIYKKEYTELIMLSAAASDYY